MYKPIRLLVLSYAFPPYKVSPGGMIRMVKFLKYIGRHRPDWVVDILTAGYGGREEKMVKRGNYLLNDVPRHMRVFRIDDPLYVIPPPSSLIVRGIRFVARKLLSIAQQMANDRETDQKETIEMVPDQFIRWQESVMNWMEKQTNLEYDAVLVTIDPNSVGLLGVDIKKKLNIPLILDNREDWSYLWVGMNKYRADIEMCMEEKIVKSADAVILVTPECLDSYQRRYPELKHFTLIPNGVDLEDFTEILNMPIPKTFTVTYLGTMHRRDPKPFFQAFKLFISDSDVDKRACKIIFPEYMSNELWEYSAQLGIELWIEKAPMMELKEYKLKLANSSVLLSLNQQGYDVAIAGKIYEYWASGRPILLLDKEGAGANLIRKFNLGIVVDPDDVNGIYEALKKFYFQTRSSNYKRRDIKGIEQFSREKLTLKLIDVIEYQISMYRDDDKSPTDQSWSTKILL